MAQHEKMLATTVGPVGHMIFNNPARHNAVSVAMWQSAKNIIETFLADPTIRVEIIHGDATVRLEHTIRHSELRVKVE